MLKASDLVGHPDGVDAAVRAVQASGLRVTGFQVLRDFEGLSRPPARLQGRHRQVDARDGARASARRCCWPARRPASTPRSDLDAHRARPAQAGDAGGAAGHQDRLRGPVAGAARSTSSPPPGTWCSRADAPNLGLGIDSFHIFATKTPLDDARRGRPATRSSSCSWPTSCGRRSRTFEERMTTARHFRVFPGEGVHSEQVAELVTRLDALGYRGDYSFEVFNDDYQQMPLPTVAERARALGAVAGRGGAAPLGATAQHHAAACKARAPASRESMTLKILVLNGPNLNLLGTREPAVYGSASLADVEALCRDTGARLGVAIECRQSNHEGAARSTGSTRPACGAARRAAAGRGAQRRGLHAHRRWPCTTRSRAPVCQLIEVHITNVHAREAFRHHSYLSPACRRHRGGLRHRRLRAGDRRIGAAHRTQPPPVTLLFLA